MRCKKYSTLPSFFKDGLLSTLLIRAKALAWKIPNEKNTLGTLKYTVALKYIGQGWPNFYCRMENVLLRDCYYQYQLLFGARLGGNVNCSPFPVSTSDTFQSRIVCCLGSDAPIDPVTGLDKGLCCPPCLLPCPSELLQTAEGYQGQQQPR